MNRLYIRKEYLKKDDEFFYKIYPKLKIKDILQINKFSNKKINI